MNVQDLALAFGDIDDKYLELSKDDAVRTRKRRRRYRVMAVVLCVLIGLGCARAAWQGQGLPIVYPSENTPTAVRPPIVQFQYDAEQFLSYEFMLSESAYVVAAQVQEVYEDLDTGTRCRYVQIVVTEVLYGDMQSGEVLLVWDDTVCTEENGKRKYSTPDGGLCMEKGNCVLLFLDGETKVRSTVDGQERVLYQTVSEDCGLFFYDTDGRYHMSAWYGDSDKSRMYVRALKDYAPRTLEEYRELIAGIVNT